MAHLATILPDGSPHNVLVWIGMVGDRGRVTGRIEGDAAWEIIDGFAVKYTGAPYQDHTGRVVYLVEPDQVQSTA